MSNDKIEIKIIKDSNQVDVNLEAMSLDVAKAFAIIVKSLIKIIEETPDNRNLTLEVKKGSASVAILGDNVKKISEDLDAIVASKIESKELVEPWRNLQRLFNANGLSYEANRVIGDHTTSLYGYLKTVKPLRSKRSKSPVNTNIGFITGKMISVGGKMPNIHVELSEDDSNNVESKVVIDCNHTNAIRANKYLYSPILVSAWVKQRSGAKQYQFCDSYDPNTQAHIFKDLQTFINNFSQCDTETESLKLLHFKCHEYLQAKNLGEFRKFLRLFNHESSDINILNTILISIQDFSSHEKLKELFDSMKSIMLQKLKTTKSKK